VKECHRLGLWLINKCGMGGTLRYIPDWQAVALDSSCQHFGLREGCSCSNPFRVDGGSDGVTKAGGGGNQCQIRFTSVMSAVIQHYNQQIHTGILVLNGLCVGGGGCGGGGEGGVGGVGGGGERVVCGGGGDKR